MTDELVAAVTAGALGLVVGALGPAVMRRLPEPELEEQPAEGEEEPESRLTFRPVYEKVTYAEVAAGPRTLLLCAVFSAALGALLGVRLGWSPELLVAGLAAPGLVWLAYIDARTTFLPTVLIYATLVVVAGAVVGLAAVDGDWSDAQRALIGALAWCALFHVFWFFGGIGYGDVRLTLLLGTVLGYLGWYEYAVGVMATALLGGLGPTLLLVLKLVDRRRNPYGPHMVAGAVVGAAFGVPIAQLLGY
ncbi:leader peptidase (prepilin peptidase)/N-methyltransferase [Marmoricola sp. OAE513]|uniref:prepilin peptidase n=1 Tax=Marmoricola sp. OAE513 TaxID=2817894 RepID=UPI001AE10B66